MKKKTIVVLIVAFVLSLILVGVKRELSFISSNIKINSISDLQTENLYKLCKIWGIMKYYHPDIVSGKINWDQELLEIMPEVIESKSPQETNQLLCKWIEQFPINYNNTNEDIEWQNIQNTDGIIYQDTEWINNEVFWGSNLSLYLSELSDIHIANRENSYAKFKKSDLIPKFDKESRMEFPPKDDGIKLLGLFRLWNAYEYYSPNSQFARSNWDEILKEYIPKIVVADTYQEYVKAICSIMSQTGDGHFSIEDSMGAATYLFGKFHLQCSIEQIGENIVVTQTGEDAEKLRPGDIIKRIDNTLIESRVEEIKKYRPYLDEHILLQTERREAKVEVIRNGVHIEITCNSHKEPYTYTNPTKNGFVDENIGYIDPSKLKDGEIEGLMNKFCNAEGIIIDLRFYPSVPILYILGEYLISEPKEFAHLVLPNKSMPGYFYKMDYFYSGKGWMKKTGQSDKEYPSYNGTVILLMNNQTMSQGETTIMALRQAKNAIVIGSNSQGTNGDIVLLELPGKIRITFSGAGVYTINNERMQQLGLTPDIQFIPTIEGISNGRDELLDEAINLLEKK